MTLDTVKINVLPHNALDIMRGLEKRVNQESWQLVEKENQPTYITFEVYVDGCPTPHEVSLSINGTWSMTTHVSLGEKL